jgi:HD-GYP domain-containing protein (c-di-GMP phosphodiesterase class II)
VRAGQRGVGRFVGTGDGERTGRYFLRVRNASAEPTAIRLAEIVGMLAAGQDNAFGQPMGSQLRSCLIAMQLAEASGLGSVDRAAVYWVALLRYLGCTGHAHEVAAVFGDDVDTRSRSVVKDLSDPHQLLPEIVQNAGGGGTAAHRLRSVLAMLAGGRRFVEMNFRTGCEVGDALLERLGISAVVRDSLQFTFEQWNGKGFPNGAHGAAIPIPMRVVRLSQDAEALVRIRGMSEGFQIIRARSGRLYDPTLVSTFLSIGRDVFAQLDKVDPWTAAMALEAQPQVQLEGHDLDRALLVVADFVDLKSVYTAGHSRGVADLAAAAASSIGTNETDVHALRRASWVHDLGRTAIPNSVWDKPGALTRAEADRVELHPLLGEQILRRCSGLSAETALAALHHERLDGSGYSKGLRAGSLPLSARILAAADRYHDLIEDRAYRPALSGTQAAVELRRRVEDGGLDGEAAEAVLVAAGHVSRRPRRRNHPAGLTDREVDVLRLAAQGRTMRQVATQLGISVKTVDHHIQRIYAKTEVGTRGALALFAIENGLVRPAQADG